MANDFFKKSDEEETKEETTEEKVKVGEVEYSQEELSKLVGLGKTAVELEEKWNTKIDRLYPEYTKKTQELAELPEKVKAQVLAEIEEEKTKEKARTGEELSEEEQLKLAGQKLEELGFVNKEKLKTEVLGILSARDLLEETQGVIEEMDKEGKPKTNVDELLAYMEETGIKNPKLAYKAKFEKELDEITQKKIQGLKGEAEITETGSTAGAKVPAPVKVTKENVTSLISEVMNREG